MEKKKRSKSKTKAVNKENGEKLQGIKSKIKQTLYGKTFRSLSIPRSISNTPNKVIMPNDKRHSRHKSNNPSPTHSIDQPINDHSWFLKMTQSNISNGSHENIELNSIHNSNNNIHSFVIQVTDNKLTYCDVCNNELIPLGSIIACKYCQIVCHEKCCKKINLPCHNNRLSFMKNIDFDQLKLTNEVKINQQLNDSEVKMRKKASNSEYSPNDSEYCTCQSNFIDINENHGSFNFYLGGIEPINCRDSLVSVTSISSIVSLSSQVTYDFTTLDHDSIKLYGIEVKPINQRATALIENSASDSNIGNSNSDTSSIKSDSSSNDSFCKSSYVYHEQTQDIIKVDWTIKDLKKNSKLFNKNNFGLTSEMKCRNGENFLLGTVRVYINLLRPIQMEFSNRPSSIFDVINYKDIEENADSNLKVETFWLPRGTSKRLYVNHSTNTNEVINGLLKKFHIKANSKKFGLYEHTIEAERRVAVRKLVDIECPLGTLLMWAEDGGDKLNETMAVKRLVLQENETGDIEWTAFSKPELKNFLLILDREEQENINKIKLKYSILKNEIQRLEKLI